MIDPRAELKRLLKLARVDRIPGHLWLDVQRVFNFANESLSWKTYINWREGRSFPATQRRQDLLGTAVGGKLGQAIKNLPSPSFRGWRNAIIREKKAMSLNTKKRSFKVVSRPDESGKPVWQAEIICAECGFTFHHSRRGSLDDDVYFRNRGWEVGRTEGNDYCPECLGKRKVVHMSDHTKKPEAVKTEMSREDGRLIFKAIESRWDDNRERYQSGWSDAKIAEKEGVSVEWVKIIRERDYGGAGEDPELVDFIAEQVTLKKESDDLHKHFQELVTSAANIRQELDKHDRLAESYRDKMTKLASKVHSLTEVATKLKPPFHNSKVS
jgi:hypothetical protein